VPPSQRISGLPPDLESLLLRCLARNPDERPHDAFAMHDALQDIVRRYAGSASIAPPHLSAASSAPPPQPREPLETIIDRKSAAPGGRETANLGRVVTHEMSSRWSTALADLEAHISKARMLGGVHGRATARAAELALVAGEMVPRVERAAKTVGELQARVDRLEAQGREFRTNLGHAIDVLVHDRSRERAHLDALRARRQALQRAIEGGAPQASDSSQSLSSQRATVPLPPIGAIAGAGPRSLDPRVWEVEAIAAEELRASKVDDDLAFQLDALQKQLDAKNEGFERELVQATGQLEGSLSALRRLTSEIVRTIDDGIGILQRTG